MSLTAVAFFACCAAVASSIKSPEKASQRSTGTRVATARGLLQIRSDRDYILSTDVVPVTSNSGSTTGCPRSNPGKESTVGTSPLRQPTCLAGLKCGNNDGSFIREEGARSYLQVWLHH